MKALIQMMGHPPEALEVLLVQFVNLKRGEEQVSMSTRAGEFVALSDVLQEVGRDATRFFLLTRRCDSHLDFDLELAKKASLENPVYYVQYAHARICGIMAYARRRLPWWRRLTAPALDALTEPAERVLIRELFQFPLVVEACARALEPHGLTVYLQRLAEAFHIFYSKQRVIGEGVAVSRARLALVGATRWVLANGLALLGVSAPHRM